MALVCSLMLCFCGIRQGAAQIVNQNNLDLSELQFDCYGANAKVQIPSGFGKPYYNWYEEGYILTVEYPDKSYVSILCGGNAVLQIPKKLKKGSYYRREYSAKSHFTITYNKVPEEKLAVFNYVFDSLRQVEK